MLRPGWTSLKSLHLAAMIFGQRPQSLSFLWQRGQPRELQAQLGLLPVPFDCCHDTSPPIQPYENVGKRVLVPDGLDYFGMSLGAPRGRADETGGSRDVRRYVDDAL